eukprot:5673436-Lingulodinium_polyedra.AAC.1
MLVQASARAGAARANMAQGGGSDGAPASAGPRGPRSSGARPRVLPFGWPVGRWAVSSGWRN